MSAILQRFTSNGLHLPSACDQTKSWDFSVQLRSKDISWLHSFVERHVLIRFEYSVLCTRLAQEFMQGHSTSSLLPRVKTALMMAELLEIIYLDFLDVPREVDRLRCEKAIYQAILSKQGYHFPIQSSTASVTIPELGVSRTIHENTASLNWARLYSIRIRRLLVSIGTLTTERSIYRQWIGEMDQWARPFLAYVGWVFFIPRLLINLSMMAKHLIPGWWMTEKEHQLGFKTRFLLQWERRWFLLGNDSAWFTVGLLNCFVLTGVLSPMALYLSLTLQAFDVVMACLRATIELNRLNQLMTEYQELLTQTDLDKTTHADIKTHQMHLQKRILFERRALFLNITNTCVLFLSLSLALPVFAINPLIPFLGATLAVLNTITMYIAGLYLQKSRPTDNINSLSKLTEDTSSLARHGFFSMSQSNQLSLLNSTQTHELETTENILQWG